MTTRQAIILTANEREVLLGMPTVDERVPTVRQQAENCGLTVEAWRAAVQNLCRLGLADYGPLVDDQDRPKGRGYYRSHKGDALAADLEGKD